MTRDSCEVVDVSPCIADPTKIKFMAKIDRALKDVLPALFLSTPNSKLTRTPMILSFTFSQHNFLIGENGDLAVTFVKDEDEVGYIVDRVIDLVNRGIKFNISNRVRLDGLAEEKRKLTPLTLYEMFPKSDCRECGESSCFNYVAKIFSGQAGYGLCPVVSAERIEKAMTPVRLGWSIRFE